MTKRTYKRLTYEQRKAIENMAGDGYRPAEIAERLGVHRSTVSRELKRVTPYNAEEAQKTINS